MDVADDRLDLLLAAADDRRPALEDGLPSDAARSAPRLPTPAWRDTFERRRDDADPNDLRLQHWGLVVPEGPAGDRLIEAIQPLVKLREAEQGAPARVYRVQPDLDATQADAWKEKVYWAEHESDQDRPLYLLMLGDLDAISVDLQHALATQTRVGRLHFADLDGYDAYARKVVRYAQVDTRETAPDFLFYVAEDGTKATTMGKLKLVAPSVSQSQKLRDKGKLPAASVQSIEAETVDELLAAGAGARPAVLLSVSHGLGAPRRGWSSEEDQRRRQGSMVIRYDEVLDAERMRNQPFLPGGMWFYLACFGAGTPSASVYRPWLETLAQDGAWSGSTSSVLHSLPKEGARPFVAALPQAALANPAGPLNVVGHVDLAWTYSFSGTDGESRKWRSLRVLHAMVRASRAGVALDALLSFYSDTNHALTSMYQARENARIDKRPDTTDAAALAQLWMQRNDLRGYVLLGDPAARLPLRRDAIDDAEPTPAEVRSSTAKSAAMLQQKAVLETLAGEVPPRAIAERAGVSLETLWDWVHRHLAAAKSALR